MKKGKVYKNLLERKTKCEVRLKELDSKIQELTNILVETKKLERTAKIRMIRRNAKGQVNLKKASIIRNQGILDKILDDLNKYD